MSKLRITYTKSMIGYRRSQKETMRALGLRKLHQTVIRPDNPAVRGMIFKVQHMVEVEELDGNVENVDEVKA
jgi:large subunit ribosomal protein L30